MFPTRNTGRHFRRTEHQPGKSWVSTLRVLVATALVIAGISLASNSADAAVPPGCVDSSTSVQDPQGPICIDVNPADGAVTFTLPTTWVSTDPTGNPSGEINLTVGYVENGQTFGIQTGPIASQPGANQNVIVVDTTETHCMMLYQEQDAWTAQDLGDGTFTDAAKCSSPPPTTQTVSLGKAKSPAHGCPNPDAAELLLTQVSPDTAPQNVNVTLNTGVTIYAPLQGVNAGSQKATYLATFGPGMTVSSATVDVPLSWSGSFQLTKYTCHTKK